MKIKEDIKLCFATLPDIDQEQLLDELLRDYEVSWSDTGNFDAGNSGKQ